MKNALVIGASKTSASDSDRFTPYFTKLGMDWLTLPEYLTRDRKLQLELALSEPKEILREIIRLYSKTYQACLKAIHQQTTLDLIMVDRATTHGLIIDNPFPRHIEGLSNDNAGKFYGLVEGDAPFLTNAHGVTGRFNKLVISLLMYQLLSVLNPRGDLIFDTAYIDPSHLEILALFFERREVWDYKTIQNSELKYDEAYQFDNYIEPKFIKFCSYKDNMHSIDIEARLTETLFPTSLEDKFDSLLVELRIMHDSISKKVTKYGPIYTDLLTSAKILILDLTAIKDEFKKHSPCALKVDKLKHACYVKIENVRKVFQQHRGFGAFNPLIRGLIGFLATITVIPAIIVSHCSKGGYKETFFGKPKTRSEKELESFQAKLTLLLNF